jgi:predicted nucleotidyltransferase
VDRAPVPMTTRKNIQKIIEEVVEKLRKDYQPEKIILYGSYAYGQPDEDSDIDLFIVKNTDKRWVDRFVEVKRIIYDQNRRISIQPMVYTPDEIQDRLAINDNFIEEIINRGEVLYAR